MNEESSIGVKVQGGIIQHQTTDIEIQCLPGDIPEYIEVDMAEVETGQIIHLSDVPLPAGVVSVALALGEDHDLAVASITAPRGTDEVEDGAAAEGGANDSAAEGDGED
jgi:large subunit ribosomal protein L25